MIPPKPGDSPTVNPYYADSWLTVYAGDCRAVLSTMEAESVHCVVTSPPYWGLRDYGTEGQLGLEPTPELYVENMVAVFREVRRVLRNDGTLWLNLGDSYSGVGAQTGGTNSKETGRRADRMFSGNWRSPASIGLKPKDLVGIPWRVAFALQADGWYLRSDIIWSKPNPMPESVTDRPTKSHEYLFLLAKSARYYFDADAVREPAEYMGPNGAQHSPYGQGFTRRTPEQERARRGKALTSPRNDGNAWNENDGRGFIPSVPGRNIRTVWTVPTMPYPGAHFAVFPPKLVEPCIKAGCPELGTVLDPFAGSGTVGLVAQKLSRRAVLIDLNPDYIDQQLRRNSALPLGLSA